MQVLTKPCMGCGQQNSVEVDGEAYAYWQRGGLIQDAFPSLTVDERELLRTGTCPPCWDRLLTPEDE